VDGYPAVSDSSMMMMGWDAGLGCRRTEKYNRALWALLRLMIADILTSRNRTRYIYRHQPRPYVRARCNMNGGRHIGRTSCARDHEPRRS